ncbi:MAG TPA: ribonuclease P protein component [Candidatus Dormibacteraeota bacterium]|nr:ribonuclease P protein component [Candidatus Dormibacteraeota bacterium]
MKRRERLSGRRRFAAVRAGRASAGTAALRVHVAANGLPHARLGFAVPKSAGGAVERNTIRRRLRAALEPHRPELAGLDVVVSASAAVLAMRFADLATELWRCIGAARSRMAENGRTRPGPLRALSPTPA